MTRTHEKVSPLPAGEPARERPVYTPVSASKGVTRALQILEGRWKLEILFHLFGGRVKRFSELERAIPAISQKMLAQQLRQMEADRLVHRRIHSTVPPKVEYSLTDWGQSLCPALDSLLGWIEARDLMQADGEAPPGGKEEAES
ncbi:MAG TPA: helix-turn-helix domain-containing protein [Dongiaceae bacterium]|nr:helix-turn-helix domain-containing protein [Dongiaceae bacterium]